MSFLKNSTLEVYFGASYHLFPSQEVKIPPWSALHVLVGIRWESTSVTPVRQTPVNQLSCIPAEKKHSLCFVDDSSSEKSWTNSLYQNTEVSSYMMKYLCSCLLMLPSRIIMRSTNTSSSRATFVMSWLESVSSAGSAAALNTHKQAHLFSDVTYQWTDYQRVGLYIHC